MEEGLEGEHDWLFDVMTEYLGSAEFNDAIMDFVDEHCDLFKNEEENKLIHTDIHNEFKEHVEMLITSKLEGFSVPATTLVEACSAGRHTRGLNMKVFNRLVALNDFLHFKKLMVKRNAELELEALREIQRHLEHRGIEDQETEAGEGDEVGKDEDIKNSILELDIMHRQEEIEQMALDQAIALSLSLSQHTTKESPAKELSSFEAKQPSAKSTDVESPKDVRSSDVPKPSHHRHADDDDDASSQPKHPSRHLQPLPPIADRRHHAVAHIKQTHSEPVDGFNPAQLYADQLRAAERMLSQQRKALANDREAAQHLIQATATSGGGDNSDNSSITTAAAVAPAKGEDLEARARHLRAVRDQLRAKKKQERQEELPTTTTTTTTTTASQPQPPQAVNEQAAQEQFALAAGDTPEQQSKGADSEPFDVSELRRQAVGMVLARRLKYDLLDAQQERLQDLQEGHIQLLDKQVQLLAMLREQSKRKEQELAQAVRRCQAQLGSNIARSRQLAQEDDELDLK